MAVNAGKSLYQPDLLIRYLTFAALGSIPSAFLQLADHFFFQSLQQTEKNKAIDTGLFWLQAGVEACIPEVMHRFAEELISGTHTKKDLASALGLLNSAGSLGYIPSIKKMANLFHNNRKIPENLQIAAKLNEIAARAGDADAMDNLAGHFGRGEGVSRDLKMCSYWIQRGSAQRCLDREKNFGTILEKPTSQGEHAAEAKVLKFSRNEST